VKPSPAVERFVERLGLASQSEGLPRISGRLLAYLMISGEPCGFDELAKALRVSRASVSTNTRVLESLGVIERVSRPGVRGDYYQLGEDPYGRLVQGALRRLHRMKDLLGDARRTFPASLADAALRVAEMEAFYELQIRHAEAAQEEWGARGRKRRPQR
jgi:DNA-binding transcriptional regulator GbsR (MarR family)